MKQLNRHPVIFILSFFGALFLFAFLLSRLPDDQPAAVKAATTPATPTRPILNVGKPLYASKYGAAFCESEDDFEAFNALFVAQSGEQAVKDFMQGHACAVLLPGTPVTFVSGGQFNHLKVVVDVEGHAGTVWTSDLYLTNSQPDQP
jgi:hypothetical protein